MANAAGPVKDVLKQTDFKSGAEMVSPKGKAPGIPNPQKLAPKSPALSPEALLAAGKQGFAAAQAHLRATACFQGLMIQGANALGGPGCFVAGAGWAAQMMGSLGARIPGPVGAAIAHGTEACVSRWAQGVTVPNLPWYPSFVAVAGPQAPPTPNVPTPLSACTNIHAMAVSAFEVEQSIRGRLGRLATDPAIGAAVKAFAAWFAEAFAAMVDKLMVVGVQAQGPVPTFAPPYVPVGPVVGGDNLASPGQLA